MSQSPRTNLILIHGDIRLVQQTSTRKSLVF